MMFCTKTWSIVCFSLLALSCTKKSESADPKKGTEQSKPAEKRSGRGGARGSGGPVAVRVKTAEIAVLPRTIDSVVSLTGRRQAEVYSKVLGRVRSVAVQEGQAVRQGTLLASIDRSDPGETFLSVPIVSPLNGWVARLTATVGSQVTTQDAIMSIVDDEALRAEVYLPVADWSLVGQKTKVTATVNNETREGKVITISRAADPATGRGSVTVEFANSKRTWKAGMIARVQLQVDPKERIVLPTSALSVTDQGAFVFIVEGDSAKRVSISYDLYSNDNFEVTKGISGGETVVVEGSGRLYPGAKVKPAEKIEGGGQE